MLYSLGRGVATGGGAEGGAGEVIGRTTSCGDDVALAVGVASCTVGVASCTLGVAVGQGVGGMYELVGVGVAVPGISI